MWHDADHGDNDEPYNAADVDCCILKHDVMEFLSRVQDSQQEQITMVALNGDYMEETLNTTLISLASDLMWQTTWVVRAGASEA